MENIKLMGERPSPNVTVNLPWAFDRLGYLRVWREFSCTNNQGVYIFDCRNDEAKRTIAKAFDDAFAIHEEHMYPVGVSGVKNPEGRIGSNRFCTMSDTLARFFTAVVAASNMLDVYPGDGNGDFVQVSKYFRAMKYIGGGEHFPHYDSDFQVASTGFSTHDTKMSLVAYGNDCETGEIGFIHPHALDGANGECRDWTRQATEDEIFLKVKPRVGRIVVFDHSLCHTVLPFTDSGDRRILRGDLIYHSA